MTTITTPSSLALVPSLETAWQDVDSSFERFCLTAGIGAIEQMLCEDAQRLAGAPHNRGGGRVGHRWGRTKGKIGFHGGKVAVHRPRVRSYDGHEVALPTWRAAQAEDWLGRWAMNLMLINVSTRKLRRAVRLPEGDLPVIAGDGTSKSAASRRFVALSAERLAEWMTSDLSKPLHASVRRVLRQAWELDDADKAERLLRNLARRLDQEAPGVAASILEGLDEMLTVNRLGLPVKLRRSLACTNSIENMMGTVRRVCRNVKRWRNAAMALRWTAAGMMEAAKGFRRLKAYKHLPILRAALAAHQTKYVTQRVEHDADAA